MQHSNNPVRDVVQYVQKQAATNQLTDETLFTAFETAVQQKPRIQLAGGITCEVGISKRQSFEHPGTDGVHLIITNPVGPSGEALESLPEPQQTELVKKLLGFTAEALGTSRNLVTVGLNCGLF